VERKKKGIKEKRNIKRRGGGDKFGKGKFRMTKIEISDIGEIEIERIR